MIKFLLMLVVVAAVAIGGYYLFSSETVIKQETTTTSPSGNVITDASVTEISVDATSWEYTPNVIRVKKGDHVKLLIANTDKTHGISIPGLGVSGIESVEFTADTVGTYEFKCPTMCGSGHREMKGTLIIEE